jgi:hypothetical protein
MGMSKLALLPLRGVIEVSGVDRVAFLQGLVSNDVAQAAPGRAVWTALLTPQGKWLADFFILAEGDRLLLDVERAQAAMLVERLGRFRLRAKVALRDRSDTLAVYAAWGGMPVLPEGAVMAPDPRVEGAGWRIISPVPLAATADADGWDGHRLGLGLPDGSVDLEAEKTVLMEAGFDELNGVSWSKGCYMGQELTARTRYRGLVKRRLVPVAIDGPAPPPGTLVLRDGIEVGALRSARDGRGLATLRLEAIGADALSCGGATLHPDVPAWMRLPEAPT